MEFLMEHVWFEDFSSSSSILENMKTIKIPSNHSKHYYEDLVWFENAKDNKAKEIENFAKGTINLQDMLTNPLAVEHTTERIQRYLGGFLFSHVGIDNGGPNALDPFDHERGQFTGMTPAGNNPL